MYWDKLTPEEKALLMQESITPEDVEESAIENLIEFFAMYLYGRDGTLEVERRINDELYT